ncbi:MAG: hypothetical protein KBA06_02975 [Saprospiraceae bacterium]|nr:hypothetical protein [Saprospiraceae bacterium]
MKNLKSILILLFISSLFVMSCKKDDDNNTTSTLLSSKAWEFEVVTTTSTDAEVLLSVGLANSLFVGTLFNFKSDGTYRFIRADSTEFETGLWTLSSDSKRLTTKKTLPTDSTSITYTIKNISSSDLKLENNQLTSDSVAYQYVIDFK